MKIEAELQDEKNEVKRAKETLERFEQNIESELPQFAKLKELEEQALNLLNPSLRNKMSEQEKAYLLERLREEQRKDPTKDFSQLYTNLYIEQYNKQRHIDSFNKYKEFSFLKANPEAVEVQTKKEYEPLN